MLTLSMAAVGLFVDLLGFTKMLLYCPRALLIENRPANDPSPVLASATLILAIPETRAEPRRFTAFFGKAKLTLLQAPDSAKPFRPPIEPEV